mmetsp:Transcript_67920/g.198728  ORF Transcript_67920/g.198728 Transcript_67920/m.198728 type:complete len:217 (+) Transcript_67920:615-1265(+)
MAGALPSLALGSLLWTASCSHLLERHPPRWWSEVRHGCSPSASAVFPCVTCLPHVFLLTCFSHRIMTQELQAALLATFVSHCGAYSGFCWQFYSGFTSNSLAPFGPVLTSSGSSGMAIPFLSVTQQRLGLQCGILVRTASEVRLHISSSVLWWWMMSSTTDAWSCPWMWLCLQPVTRKPGPASSTMRLCNAWTQKGKGFHFTSRCSQLQMCQAWHL